MKRGKRLAISHFDAMIKQQKVGNFGGTSSNGKKLDLKISWNFKEGSSLQRHQDVGQSVPLLSASAVGIYTNPRVCDHEHLPDPFGL